MHCKTWVVQDNAALGITGYSMAEQGKANSLYKLLKP